MQRYLFIIAECMLCNWTHCQHYLIYSRDSGWCCDGRSGRGGGRRVPRQRARHSGRSRGWMGWRWRAENPRGTRPVLPGKQLRNHGGGTGAGAGESRGGGREKIRRTKPDLKGLFTPYRSDSKSEIFLWCLLLIFWSFSLSLGLNRPTERLFTSHGIKANWLCKSKKKRKETRKTK